ncbi:hypothetical protein BH10ACT10_BH10ACT10_17000 [soil metagenome]
MRFSEHELTTALTGTAKQLLAGQRKDVRKGRAGIDEVWDGMNRYERFKILDALGTQLFPVLGALPDVEVAVGARPSYTDQEVQAAVEQSVDESAGGRLRRKAVVAARVAVVRMALQQVPPKPNDSGPVDPR